MSPAPNAALRLTRQVLPDPQLANLPAFAFLLPEGWQVRGGVAWDPNTSLLATLRLQLIDPASAAQIEWLPTAHFVFMHNPPGYIAPGGNWMGQTFLPPIGDPAQFVQHYWAASGALPHLRGLMPVAGEERPAVAQQYAAGQPGWQARAFRLRYAFTANNRPWEEDVYLVLNFAPLSGSPVITWNVQGAIACRAPAGDLDRRAALFRAVCANASFTPQWLASYTVCRQLFQQRMLQWVNDNARFAQQLSAYNAHVHQLSQQIHDDRMRSWDAIAQSQREYLGGVETRNDPYDGQGVYVPAGYASYWQNANGEIVMFEQPGIDPNQGGTTEWRDMSRRDPMAYRRT